MTTGEKISECRKKMGLTQEQLANTLGVTRQAVSRWESDLAFPETDNLTRMCRLFGVSCDWLLNYDGQERTEPPAGQAKAPFVAWDLNKLYFEYKSKTHIGKLPLVHINIGLGRVAKGFFSFGLVSVGVFSFGLLSLGLLAFGTLCLGLLSFGAAAFGAVAFGGLSIGLIALGGCALGLFSMGGCAIGLFACGGYASGSIVAIGDTAVGGIALGDTRAEGSIIAVLKADYIGMKDAVFEKFAQIPKVWSVFSSWSRGLANTFMAHP